MKLMTRTRMGAVAFIAAAALGLSACSSGGDAETADPTEESSNGGAAVSEVTDMAGNTVTLPENAEAVIATDNRVFGTLADWDIDLVAAPVDLMPENEQLSKYLNDDAILNIGNHREPDMEIFVSAAPDLILNGQRFAQYGEEIQELAPDAAFVDTNLDLETTAIDEGLRDITTLLGDVFGKQDDATKLVEDFDASIERATAAYDADMTVTGVLTSGGDINYAAPTTGRAIGPVFDVLGLTPAMDREGSTNHQGDDISVEAIAESNPDFLIVLDRDAGAGTPDAATAQELIEESEALQNVTAVQEGNIVYMNPDFYTAEDIQHYTELFNALADAWEAN